MPPRPEQPFVPLGAGAYIISPEGKLLLIEQVRRGKAWWGTVGGGLQHGETLEECAVREAYEESGLRVRLLRLVNIEHVWRGGAFIFVGFYFLAEPEGWPQAVAMPEMDGNTRFLRHGWFARDELPAIENIPSSEFCLECWPAEITSAVLRRRDFVV